MHDTVDFTVQSDFLVTSDRYELGDGAARRAEFHRNDSGIADNLAAVGFDLLGGLLDVLDLDREMMDTRSVAGCLGLCRLRAGIVFHQCEIDRAISHMTRYMIAGFLGLGILEPETFLIKRAGLLKVIDL